MGKTNSKGQVSSKDLIFIIKGSSKMGKRTDKASRGRDNFNIMGPSKTVKNRVQEYLNLKTEKLMKGDFKMVNLSIQPVMSHLIITSKA